MEDTKKAEKKQEKENTSHTIHQNHDENLPEIITSHDRHFFDPELANQIGIQEAIIVQHFIHWIQINKRAGRNFHDGRTWTYQTLEEIKAHFPYLSLDQIRDALFKLEHGRSRKSKKQSFKPIIKTGNYNKSSFDRTSWYAFENEELFIKVTTQETHSPKSGNEDDQSHLGNFPNGFGEIPRPIPDNITRYKNLDKENITKESDASKDAGAKAPNAEKAKPDISSKYEIKIETEDEVKLLKIMSKEDLEFWKQQLLTHLISIGKPKKYKSHYATILNWHNKEERKRKLYKQSSKKETHTDESFKESWRKATERKGGLDGKFKI